MTRARKNKKPVVAVLVILLIVLVALAAVVAMEMGLIGKGAYPLEYEGLISRYAEEYDLDPYLVAAVIKTESGFDPEAVSPKDARGLMQIMPETGAWIAGKLGINDFSEDDLFDPEVNIRFGCWYLNFLDDRFGGDMELVAAGYNAGHNRVSEWLADAGVSKDGKTLENIPFAETEQYVKKVKDAYEKYREYYPDVFG